MSGFTVDPDTLPPLADQLRQAAGQLQSAWDPVKQQSESVHFGRGDDVLSPLIQVSLEGAVALVNSCITSSVDALHGYADGLQSMAKTYADAEQGTASIMKPQ